MVDGDPNAPILLIAMSPGREELHSGTPLIGAAGKLTWTFARRGGWGREDCYIINVIGEWPAKKNGGLSKEQVDKYWDIFNEYLQKSTARVAVCLGGDAFDRLTGIITHEKRENRGREFKNKTGIEAWRGYLVSPEECVPRTRTVKRYDFYKKATKKHKAGDPKITRHVVVEESLLPKSVRYILPTIHPASVLRSGLTTIPAFAADLARVGRALRGELVTRHADWSEVIFASQPPEPIALDIETRRPVIASDQNVITRVGMAVADRAWTRPWDDVTKQAVQAEVDVAGRPIIIHNAPFDVIELEQVGINFKGDLWDSMMAAVQVQPDLYKGLNAVAPLYLDGPRWKHKSEEQPDYYNATDAIKERHLYEPLCADLDRTGQRRLFEDVVMPGVRTLINMKKRGVKMHPERTKEWTAQLQTKWEKLHGDWSTHTGGVDPDSNPRIAEYFYQHLNLPEQNNKYGGVTCDEAALTALRAYCVRMGGNPTAERSIGLLLEYRETATLLRNFAKSPFSDDGCVHPSYLPLQKDDDRDDTGKGMPGTGRIGARKPNLANQPKEARRLYIPHSPDMEWVSADHKQAEVQIAAALSNDKALQEALKGDIHARNMEILHCDRTRAKNVLFGTLYGGGPRKLARVLQGKGIAITEAEIKSLQSALAVAYPDLFRWRQRLLAEVSRNYYLTTPFGRRRYFNRGSKDAPAAFDFPPQATTADIMWHHLHPQALEAGFQSLGGALLLTVYDSVEGEVPRGRRKETEVMLRDVMERRWDQIAPGFFIPIEIKWGDDWGSVRSVSPEE